MGTHFQTASWIARQSKRLVEEYHRFNATNPFTIDPLGFDGYVPSSQRSHPPYHVVVAPPTQSCTCYSFKYRSDCQHVAIVKEALNNFDPDA